MTGIARERKRSLREIALRVSERVRRTGERAELGLMNPSSGESSTLRSRRQGVRTESAGDGVMKRVVILPA